MHWAILQKRPYKPDRLDRLEKTEQPNKTENQNRKLNMKKLLLTMTVLLASIAANAQKFALVDMEYILKYVPA